MFPEKSLTEEQTLQLRRDLMRKAGRSLVLTPNKPDAETVSKDVTEHLKYPVFTADDLEVSKTGFTSSAHAAAVIANRYELMSRYARGVRAAVRQELAALKARRAQESGGVAAPDASLLKATRRWLHRDADRVPERAQGQLAQARAAHPVIDQMLTMREELRQLWLNTSLSREQLTSHLQAWCQRAEASGIAALREFSQKLRAVHP